MNRPLDRRARARAVFFDLDDTLTESTAALQQAALRAADVALLRAPGASVSGFAAPDAAIRSLRDLPALLADFGLA